MDQNDFEQSLGEGPTVGTRLVEALLLLCQGDFTFRLPRTLARDQDDTVAFFFNAIAEELERLLTTARENEARMSKLIEVLTEAFVAVAAGDFSVQVERDFRGDQADVLSFLVNNTITEFSELAAASGRRAADDRQRLELLVEARTLELRVLASTDELTATLNRRRILEVAGEECQRKARYQDSLCIAMFDIDHFKAINDQFGHSVGDHALRLVAAAARSQLRMQDHIGRYGGEEFLIVFPETPLEGAMRVTERVRAAVEAMAVHEGGHRIPLTVSAGVSEVAEGETLDSVLRRVDAAMYRAKAAGRNQVVI